MHLATTLLLLTSMVFPHTAQAASYELKGCYKKADGLTSKGSYQWQSAGYCMKQCRSYAVMAMKAGSECYCADELPPSSDKTDDSDCDTGCNGFPDDDCGGDDVYSFYYTGNKKPKVQSDTSTSSTTAASSTTLASTTTTSAPSTTASLVLTTSGGHTVYVTPTTAPDTQGTTEKKSGGTNKAAIAAGVVVGVVGAAAIIAAIIFWLKRRNREKVEDEYRRNAQLSDYVAGGAAAGNGREKYGHDQRLDPSAQRRLSNGSIADDQDYSRKILHVTNPDQGYY